MHVHVHAHIPAPLLLIFASSVAHFLEGGSAPSGSSPCPSEHRLLSSSLSLFFFFFSFFFTIFKSPECSTMAEGLFSEVLMVGKKYVLLNFLQTKEFSNESREKKKNCQQSTRKSYVLFRECWLYGGEHFEMSDSSIIEGANCCR